jgi:hypothetical protein
MWLQESQFYRRNYTVMSIVSGSATNWTEPHSQKPEWHMVRSEALKPKTITVLNPAVPR